MGKKWVRTPKHILRIKCIEHISSQWKPGSFVEFGAGTGDITSLFLNQGYHGHCYDLGDENREILRSNLSSFGHQAIVVDNPETLSNIQFDYLFAFEVLEHIKNDAVELRNWSRFLKKDGRILISVPAHQRKFSEEDYWAGHVRRYEKTQLVELLNHAGYTDITILNYGFPLGNLTRYVSMLLHRSSRDEEKHLSAEEKSIKSGVERINKVTRLDFLFNNIFMTPFFFLQKLFFQRDWGDGYVASATKR